jgi:hypothetical protein
VALARAAAKNLQAATPLSELPLPIADDPDNRKDPDDLSEPPADTTAFVIPPDTPAGVAAFFRHEPKPPPPWRGKQPSNVMREKKLPSTAPGAASNL